MKTEGECSRGRSFSGEFASIINKNFPDRELFLFDTFEGFDEREVAYEADNKFSEAVKGQLNITSEKLVLSRMRFPENCIIKKDTSQSRLKGLTWYYESS